MARQFDLGALFRLMTVMGLLSAWLGMARSGALPEAIFVALVMPGVFILAPLVVARRQTEISSRFLTGLGFVIGWSGVALYLSVVSILLNPYVVDWDEIYKELWLDEVTASAVAVYLFIPATGIAFFLHNAWVNSRRDRTD
ncbi:MAG: hypothetical protein MPJ50_04430 [Pirellulales bacterium]|nr:hypothetical protein [Pirellulales bacterium]